jgi:hypothetical protein
MKRAGLGLGVTSYLPTKANHTEEKYWGHCSLLPDKVLFSCNYMHLQESRGRIVRIGRPWAGSVSIVCTIQGAGGGKNDTPWHDTAVQHAGFYRVNRGGGGMEGSEIEESGFHTESDRRKSLE